MANGKQRDIAAVLQQYADDVLSGKYGSDDEMDLETFESDLDCDLALYLP